MGNRQHPTPVLSVQGGLISLTANPVVLPYVVGNRLSSYLSIPIVGPIVLGFRTLGGGGGFGTVFRNSTSRVSNPRGR